MLILITEVENKLGTRQLPTAELLLDGTEAHLVLFSYSCLTSTIYWSEVVV